MNRRGAPEYSVVLESGGGGGEGGSVFGKISASRLLPCTVNSETVFLTYTHHNSPGGSQWTTSLMATTSTSTLVFSVLYGLLAVLITSANVLIIAIFSGRKLRHKKSSVLLLCLAVVDITIGSVAVPLLIAVNLGSSTVRVRLASSYVDVITGLTSIFTLAVISLERMCAVCWPFRHRTLNSRIYMFASCLPWILVIPGAIAAKLANDRNVNNVLISFSLVLPLITICSAYFVIWKKRQDSLQHRSTLQEAQERKLAKTMLMIIGAFVVTWLPFLILNIYVMACSNSISCDTLTVPRTVTYIIVFLRLSNSFVNFLVYALRMPDFREHLCKTFLRIRQN